MPVGLLLGQSPVLDEIAATGRRLLDSDWAKGEGDIEESPRAVHADLARVVQLCQGLGDADIARPEVGAMLDSLLKALLEGGGEDVFWVRLPLLRIRALAIGPSGLAQEPFTRRVALLKDLLRHFDFFGGKVLMRHPDLKPEIATACEHLAADLARIDAWAPWARELDAMATCARGMAFSGQSDHAIEFFRRWKQQVGQACPLERRLSLAEDLALAAEAAGDVAGAVSILEEEISEQAVPDPEPAVRAAWDSAATELGRMLYSSDRIVLARGLFTQLLGRSSDSDTVGYQWWLVRYLLAACEFDLGEAQIALRRLEDLATRLAAVVGKGRLESGLNKWDWADLIRRLAQTVEMLAAWRLNSGDLLGAELALRPLLSEASEPIHRSALEGCRNLLAQVYYLRGDYRSAAEVCQALVDESLEFGGDPQQLATIQTHLALCHWELGDPAAARKALSAVGMDGKTASLDVYARLTKEMVLALAAADAGEGDATKLHTSNLRALAAVHPLLQDEVQPALVYVAAATGDSNAAVENIGAYFASSKRRLQEGLLVPRTMLGLAAESRRCVDAMASLALGCGNLPAMPDLAGDLLWLQSAIHGIDVRCRSHVRRNLTDANRGKFDRLQQIAAALVASGATEDAPGAGARRASLLAEQDRLEHDLLEGSQATAAKLLVEDHRQLAALLPPKTAAVCFFGFTRYLAAATGSHRLQRLRRLGALVLRNSGEVTVLDLASEDLVVDLVARFRALHGGGSARGRDPEAAIADPAVELQRVVLAPITEAIADVGQWIVTCDDVLELVSMDALPLPGGGLVGDRLRIVRLTSLHDLAQPLPVTTGGGLLAIGGIDYDLEKPGARDARAVVPPPQMPLPQSDAEVTAIDALFRKHHDGVGAFVLREGAATKAELKQRVGGARFLHFATHGYFDLPSEPAPVASSPLGPIGGLAVAEISPLVLCGLALSGANDGHAGTGPHPGRLTGEELAALDLSRCEVAVLSACSTSLGVRRAGQGFASLRSAVAAAGARYVISSLWPVGDQATMRLMTTFYYLLWVRGMAPEQAFWEARMQLRSGVDGQATLFRDWGGWVLMGR